MMYALTDVVQLELPRIVMILMSVPMIVVTLTLESARTPTIILHVTMVTLVHCTMFVTMVTALLVILENAMMRTSVPTIPAILQRESVYTLITMLLATMEMFVQWMMYAMMDIVQLDLPSIVTMIMSVQMILVITALANVCTLLTHILVAMVTLVHMMFATVEDVFQDLERIVTMVMFVLTTCAI